jgi:3',5'-nucleoside bisphosphate phosphatase
MTKHATHKHTALADLHTHTTHSDGALSPEELLRKAVERGLKGIAITDHDTASGAREALRLLATINAENAENGESVENGEKTLPIEVLSGIEVSAFDPELEREYHILGSGIDVYHPELLQYEAQCREQRIRRAEAIVEKLHQMNLALEMTDVLRQSRTSSAASAAGIPEAAIGVIGRQHIALALCEAGITYSPQQAFNKYLGDHRPAFVEKWHFPVARAIDLIHQCGGMAVLAHPAQTIHGLPLVNMVKSGLDGIEVIHPSHTPYLQRYYEQFAKGYGLFATGGSDFHGNKWGDEANFGKVAAPYAVFTQLEQANKEEFAFF